MNIHETIHAQYRAVLEMLRNAIVQCPESLWYDTSYKNQFWQIAYHALINTHTYLQPTEADFVPWEKTRDVDDDFGKTVEPYTKAEILEYFELCKKEVDKQVPALDLDAPPGFDWFTTIRNKLDLQFYNLRHLQQHTGELYERLGSVMEMEETWVGALPSWR